MNHLQTFQVFPNIPKPLSFLETLSRNIWWSWHFDAVELFRRVDPRLWDKAGRNPLIFSTYISQERLAELAADESFLAHLQRVRNSFKNMIGSHEDGPEFPLGKRETIAYFSMEFGIHESIPLFAGGLGILAGDHLKAASDMGLPLTGMGLLYRHGYFRQYLDQSGWQQEEYPETDFFHMPMRRVKDRSGKKYRFRSPVRTAAKSLPMSGKSEWDGFRFIFWIPICRKILLKPETSLPDSMPGRKIYGRPRKHFWESAA